MATAKQADADSRAPRGIDAVRPGDEAYEETRLGWNLLYQRRPAEILLPTTTEEVVACIRNVTHRKVPFRVRSGGHDYDGESSVDDGVVIDLRRLNNIAIDDDVARVRVGPGATLGAVYAALAPHKLALAAGLCSGVRVGGHCLGGGNGLLHRFLGVNCDQLLAATMVTATGEVIQASADQNPDLLWALRGGGNGNFGIVTELIYQATPVTEFASLVLSWDPADYEQVLRAWQDWAPFTDTRLTSTFVISKDRVMVMIMFAGPEKALSTLLPRFLTERACATGQRIREYGDYAAALTGIMSEYASVDNADFDEHVMWSSVAVMTDQLDETARAIIGSAVRGGPGQSSVAIYARGGKICEPAPDATAYPWRTSTLEPLLRTTWQDENDREPCMSWIDELFHQLEPYIHGVYKNGSMTYLVKSRYRWYAGNLPKLIAIKRTYDPDNVFSHPAGLPVYVTQQHIDEWDLPADIVAELRAQGSLA
ncbi:FAD-binding oxidoreductase [Nocardia sp. CDC159]|uniref:FAD-binding oxidoreductase n=1 Tax=Nocardia pulmonis TaxID=2951408 RepID=A0A9X2IZS8_9NOCA|nr:MULTISPECIES: FAD-binding oxidoreductase [Nocardia]MCM6778432.1 FAD-binding oxidoreductase [Nocardia pulmonis]MCM6791321.1 FAD-binding oxidoreductase [Nocardia sp. CDC159]